MDPSLDPPQGHKPFGLTLSPYSLILCPTSGFDAFLVLITSPSSYSTFSSFASPEISLNLSIFFGSFPLPIEYGENIP